MKIRIFLLLIGIFGLGAMLPKSVLAITDPLQMPNNRFGIHIIDENDLFDASDLVNSNGGAWGYVTLVIREDERDVGRWQRVMDKMRELKLVPIVRIATKNEGGMWNKPTAEEAESWATFLDSLNWPIKNKYVVLFNEPNHKNEWGGEINPSEYAVYSRIYWEELKKKSRHFFILPAGIDLAAPDGPTTMNASTFFDQMHEEDEKIFEIFDGWTSHSYPNPGFSGSPDDTGKMSVRGYAWEIEYLEKYGISQNIPVFITETGWINKGRDLADFYNSAYENAWSDPRIVAITPFLLNYTGEPFEVFSWKHADGYYSQYDLVKELPKTSGDPEQVHSFEFAGGGIPGSLVRSSVYNFEVQLKNTGQSIWESGKYELVPESDSNLDIKISGLPETKPGEIAKINIDIGTFGATSANEFILRIYKDSVPTEGKYTKTVNIVPPPSLLVFSRNLVESSPTYSDSKLTIYEGDKKILEFTNLLISQGLGQINELYDIVPNREYTFSFSRPYYLTKERRQLLMLGENRVDFGIMFPLDLNNDSELGALDIIYNLANPSAALYSVFTE